MTVFVALAAVFVAISACWITARSLFFLELSAAFEGLNQIIE
jgi:hypothetical protein